MRRRLITTKSLFTISLTVAVLTIILVYLTGLESHRSFFNNSLISLTVLASAFFSFITFGLYDNYKLEDDVGTIMNKKKLKGISDSLPRGWDGVDFTSIKKSGGDEGQGCGEDILGIFAWILVGILVVVFLYTFGMIFWGILLGIVAMLYWIFFRALRFVFKMGPVCKGNFLKSAGYGLLYSLLYSSWMYGILFILKK